MRRYYYNYTKLMKREKRIYNAGFEIPGGISYTVFKVCVPIFLVIVLIGWFISLFFNINMFNPLEDNFNLTYTLIIFVIGIGIAGSLYWIEFGGYRLYEYLIAYMRPKKVITNQESSDGKHIRNKVRNLTNIKYKTIVRKKV